MSDKDTAFYLKELMGHLKRSHADYDWAEEKTIQGKELNTAVDILGTNDERAILIQFEMRRRHPTSNPLKAVYCLGNDAAFKNKQALILHVFSPFYDGRPYDIEDHEIPGGYDKKEYRKYFAEEVVKENARRGASNDRVLCRFLESQGWLDSPKRTYRVVEWRVVDAKIRKGLIVRSLSEEEQRSAIAGLARQIDAELTKWESTALLTDC
jgi:hypothetical protein